MRKSNMDIFSRKREKQQLNLQRKKIIKELEAQKASHVSSHLSVMLPERFFIILQDGTYCSLKTEEDLKYIKENAHYAFFQSIIQKYYKEDVSMGSTYQKTLVPYIEYFLRKGAVIFINTSELPLETYRKEPEKIYETTGILYYKDDILADQANHLLKFFRDFRQMKQIYIFLTHGEHSFQYEEIGLQEAESYLRNIVYEKMSAKRK